MRQLARHTAAVLDRVREADAPIIVTRHGRPVAAIHPLEIDPWAPIKTKPDLPELEESELELGTFELDEPLKKVLWFVEEWFSLADIRRLTDLSVSDTLISCGRLEVKGLAAKGRMGYRLTRTGRRVAEELRGS